MSEEFGIKVLVVGAGGRIGSRVTSRLLGKATVRAMAHSDASHDRLRGLGVEDVVRADLADPTTLLGAFSGIDRVFLAIGGDVSLYTNAVEAAANAGVRRIVKLSSESVCIAESLSILGPPASGPDTRDGATRVHQDSDARIVASGIDHVVLRPTWFMSFDETAFVAPGLSKGELVWPAGDTTLALIAPDDIADVAVACLLADEPPAAVLQMTGPEALTLEEVAIGYSRAFDREITYVAPPMADYGTYLESVGLPAAAASIIEAFVRRGAAPVTDDVERVLGRPPRTFDHYLSELVRAS